METQMELNDECFYYKEVPRSLISDYTIFFSFILPKNVENKEVIISIPKEIFYDAATIKNH
ncbi:hypothetical protein HS5_06980 [Acidianus sp. HS-5]|nr:hypothetical protein HS5_06980 [Acidianus sp. HS-5]